MHRGLNIWIMNRIITDKLPELIQLCKQYSVGTMYLFGSAATGTMKPDSDIDILVTFEGVELFDYFDNLIGFKQELEKLFNHPVDLLEEKAIRNPVLRRTIDNTKQLIYGRTG